MDTLRKTFTFREWHSGSEKDELTYCGAKIVRMGDKHWKIHHSEYLGKQKPISFPKDRHQQDVPVTETERTALRAVLGGLQWPSTQTAPWLQAAVSLMAGSVTKATTQTLLDANKILRYAKENADVGLEYRCLGEKDNMTFIAFSDASFACRPELSSQCGYLLAMVDKTVAEGAEGHYNVLDWRSWKLARISRSTLAAESQAASEAADSLLFTSTFWNLIWKPWRPLTDVQTAKMPAKPHLIVDAKALYDLLGKPEVQANSGSDKRTTIEVLVTQDKLTCCGATTLWVSSEQQYADGLTKQSAAQLLAERLRSHLVRLKSDKSFQAAKKKTPQERKKNSEMFAIKKPKRALTAMFSMCWTSSAATNVDNPDNTTFTYNLFNFDIFKFLFTVVMAIVMGWVITGCWRRGRADRFAEEETLEEDSNPATRTVEIQTDIHGDAMVTMEEFFEEKQRLETYIEEETVPLYVHDALRETQFRELNIYYEALAETNQRIGQQNREHFWNLHSLTQAPVYFTRSGRCWHADRACLDRYATTEIIEKGYCTRCSHTLGRILPLNDDP